ncbi:MAG: repair protein RecO [Bacteroidota bacterium]
MLHKTKGLVLRSVKYGDTSLIVSIYTELFGLQSYMVNGVRTFSSKQPYRANMFQPSSLLDMVVYHNDRSTLQRIKEFKWAVVYEDIYQNIHKNTVALFMSEVIQKCLTQPEANPDLFNFLEDAFIHLDRSKGMVIANFPLFFLTHLAHFFGFRLNDNYSESEHILDLQEGVFLPNHPAHPFFLDMPMSTCAAELLRTIHPDSLGELSLNREQRKVLLDAFVSYYAFHQSGFGSLRSLPVLHSLYEI